MIKNILKKAKAIIITFALIALISQSLAISTPSAQAVKPKVEYFQTSEVSAKQVDERARVLQAYLAKHNSPMQYQAQNFIEAADANGVDWKLVPAIAGVESTFGKHTPGSDTDPSYNGWGWGVYNGRVLRFDSWKDGIYTLNKGLKEKYINRGLETPAEMNRIYASSKTWGIRVDHFMNEIEEFEANYKNPSEPVLSKTGLNPVANSTSAVLASK